MKIGIWSNP